MEFAGTNLNLVRSEMSERIMSDEFDGLDATKKAAVRPLRRTQSARRPNELAVGRLAALVCALL
jgi:hypothetical protein